MAGTPRASSASGMISTKPESGGFEESLKLRLSVLQGSIISDYNRHNSYLQAEVESLRKEVAELQLQMQPRWQKQLTPPADACKDIQHTDEVEPASQPRSAMRKLTKDVPVPARVLPPLAPTREESASVEQDSTEPSAVPSIDVLATGDEASPPSKLSADDQSVCSPVDRPSLDTLPLSFKKSTAADPPAGFKKSGSLESQPGFKKSGSVESQPGFGKSGSLEQVSSPRRQRNSTKSTVSFQEDEMEKSDTQGSLQLGEKRNSLQSNISASSFLQPPKSQKGRKSNASSAGPSLRGSLVSNVPPSQRGSVRSNHLSRTDPVWEQRRPSQQRSWGSRILRMSRGRNSTRNSTMSIQSTPKEENGKVGPMQFILKLSHVRGSSRQSVETINGCMHTGQIEHIQSGKTDPDMSEIGEEPEEQERGFLPAKSVEVNALELQSVCHAHTDDRDQSVRYSSFDEDHKFIVHPQWVKKQKKQSCNHLAHADSMKMENGYSQWDDGAGQCDIDEEAPWQVWERFLKPVILKPTSPIRMIWDMIGFIFILWDTIMLPLEFFKPEETPFIIVMTWLVRIYWSADFPLSFLTGFDRPEGSVETRPSSVARKYVRTWFAFDVVIITFDWLEIAVEGMKGLAALRMGKIGKAVRLLRMVRLLRVLKLNRGVAVPEVIKIIFYKMSSERISIFLGMIRMILFLTGVVHFIACCWYGIGCDGTEPNWVEIYQIGDEEFKYVYMTSFHWALTQFAGSMDIQPQNFRERLFAVSALLFGFIFAAFVVSSITSSMTRLQIVMARQSTQVSMLNHYLWDNGISAKLALRVQRNAMHAAAQDARNTPEEEIELLALVSEPLQIEMHYEIYCPTLQRHPFFNLYKDKNYPAMRRICHAATSRVGYFAGDIIFHVGEDSQEPRMYFCLSGQMDYAHCQGVNEEVTTGTWLCEYCLWTSWTHCGSLRAQSQLTLVAVDALQFLEIASQFQTGEFYPFKYAQLFAVALNKIDKLSLTDLSDPRMCLEALAKKAFDPMSSHLFRRKSRMTRVESDEHQAALQQEVQTVLAAKQPGSDTGLEYEAIGGRDEKGNVIAKITKTLSNLSNIGAGLVRTNTNMSFRESHCRSTTRSTTCNRETTCTMRSTNRWTNVMSADNCLEGEEEESKANEQSTQDWQSEPSALPQGSMNSEDGMLQAASYSSAPPSASPSLVPSNAPGKSASFQGAASSYAEAGNINGD